MFTLSSLAISTTLASYKALLKYLGQLSNRDDAILKDRDPVRLTLSCTPLQASILNSFSSSVSGALMSVISDLYQQTSKHKHVRTDTHS